jgi:hypothetical protein
MGVTEQDLSVTLKSSYDFPIFTKNLQEILNSYQLSKEIY